MTSEEEFKAALDKADRNLSDIENRILKKAEIAIAVLESRITELEGKDNG